MIDVYKQQLTNDNISKNLTTSKNLKMIYVLQGRAEWNIDQTCYYVNDNDIFLLNNITRRIFRKICTDSLSLIIIEFAPELLIQYKAYNLFVDNSCIQLQSHSNISEMINYMENESKRKDAFADDIMKGLLITVLSLLSRENKPKNHSNDLNNEILAYIAEHLDEDLQIKNLAKKFAISYWEFSRYFSKNNYMSVTNYITKMRIQKSIFLIENTDSNMLDIAMQCGFNNSASFYKSFKKITNSTPSKYRQNTTIEI